MPRYRIRLEGIVQGVGFRPFVKRLADRLNVSGVVFNTSQGVVIEVDTEHIATFIDTLQSEAPAAALIERSSWEVIDGGSFDSGFRILESAGSAPGFTLVSPDLATCPACLAETQDPANRRFGYAFTNCTLCGPRYTIVRRTPYDRANTSMACFPMCPECRAEYENPSDRRFHAEPIACPVCGPSLSGDLAEAIGILQSGRILALKGLGGYQLACDAFCESAVSELRRRKRRTRKPFAVMMKSVAVAERHCVLDEASRAFLISPAAPILLLARNDSSSISPSVAPGLGRIGVMLPYTPLHHLLFESALDCLVMTSGNVSEEPIVTDNAEAQHVLSPLSDCVLIHNRDIVTRVDDSVMRVFEGTSRVLRRARGYAPAAIRLTRRMDEVLACGAELKSTFCITKGEYAIPSQHIGDLANHETLRFFRETLDNLSAVHRATPRLIVHDLHPDYLGTRWALARPEPKLGVQHHHAHAASCMAENGLEGPVIGVVFDGTGWGGDGQIWGGEFLLADLNGYRRAAHLRYVALIGGDQAARQPWRMAAAHLHDAFGKEFPRLPCLAPMPAVFPALLSRPGIRTSSAGRLFDAVAAICGIPAENGYEGESAMLLEQAASSVHTDRRYEIPADLDTRPMIREIVRDFTSGQSPAGIARCFHNSMAHMIESVCGNIRQETGVNRVCLSGGVFQNWTLLESSVSLLRAAGFEVFLHSKVPPNDGGISLGQAVIGAAYLERTESHVPRDPR